MTLPTEYSLLLQSALKQREAMRERARDRLAELVRCCQPGTLRRWLQRLRQPPPVRCACG